MVVKRSTKSKTGMSTTKKLVGAAVAVAAVGVAAMAVRRALKSRQSSRTPAKGRKTLVTRSGSRSSR